jgi:hypothetical protein
MRFLPPLVIDQQEIDTVISRVTSVLQGGAAGQLAARIRGADRLEMM